MNPAVLIPCYNEAVKIGEVVKTVLSYVKDVVVVDDGSTDGTGALAREAGAAVIRHDGNKGKGEALRTGFGYIKENKDWDCVIIMDGDGQHDWNDIPRFVETDASIVIGDRITGTMPFVDMPIVRWLTNRFTSYVISKITGQRIPDSQCGYRLIRTSVLRDLELITSGFDTESEILIKSARLGYRIVSLPIKSIYHGEVSYINPLRDTIRFVRLIYGAIHRD